MVQNVVNQKDVQITSITWLTLLVLFQDQFHRKCMEMVRSFTLLCRNNCMVSEILLLLNNYLLSDCSQDVVCDDLCRRYVWMHVIHGRCYT